MCSTCSPICRDAVHTCGPAMGPLHTLNLRSAQPLGLEPVSLLEVASEPASEPAGRGSHHPVAHVPLCVLSQMCTCVCMCRCACVCEGEGGVTSSEGPALTSPLDCHQLMCCLRVSIATEKQTITNWPRSGHPGLTPPPLVPGEEDGVEWLRGGEGEGC